MRHKSGARGTASDKAIKDIRRATRKQYSAEEKIRIVLDGLRGSSRSILLTEVRLDFAQSAEFYAELRVREGSKARF